MSNETEKQSVLIVDDVAGNIELLAEVLEDDYQLFIATNGKDALDVVANNPIDLILLDVMMPGMDGYEVCRRLKSAETTRFIPIIFVTGKTEVADETMALEQGAVDFLHKPVNPIVVKARVKTHLGLKNSREILKNQNTELLEAAQLRDDVDRITRHDLKGPLNSIISFTTLLLSEEGLTEDQLEMLKFISDYGYKLLEMISLSLDMFKMEKKTYSFDPKPVDVLALIKKVVRGSESQASYKKVTYTLLLEGQPPGAKDNFEVYAEELLCYSLFNNLLKNALEASPRGGVITISFQRTATSDIAIHNLGSVPKEIRDSFFQKYATFGKKDGTGLGSYSAKLMAETQKGSIHLHTDDEKGTVITVCLQTPP